jgi:N-acetylglucosaminyl-diphospho-decaprenol L-rhamnosyltransferase
MTGQTPDGQTPDGQTPTPTEADTPPETGPPEVSVVIVTFRSRELVLRCLAALAAHAGVDHEAIVVDDRSEDGTVEAVRERFPAATVIAKPHNEGLVAGRNTALEHVHGRYVLMLDADTEVRPGALPALVAALQADPTVGLVSPKLVYPDGELQLSCHRYPPLLVPILRRGPLARLWPDPPSHRRHMMKDFDHAANRPVAWTMGAAQMWRSELPAQIGPYDRALSSYGGEDIDWCLRVWAAGLRVLYVPLAEVVHVHRKVTRKRQFSRQSWRALRDWYYIQWKHRSLRRDPRLASANA